jgi:hypothetical protein
MISDGLTYRNFRFVFLLATIVGAVSSAIPQNPGMGSWNILNLKYGLTDRWSLFGEAQLRSLKFYRNFHYYEYKGGFAYRWLPNVSLAMGAGSYQTYREGGDFIPPKNNDDFRIWPQVQLLESTGKVRIEQRYRWEFRFTSSGYRNRIRYRLGLVCPIGKARDGYQPFQVTASNEVFFGTREPYFERNRLLLTLNYKPSKSSMLQIGYLHQFDYKINDETGRAFFQIGYFYEIFRNAQPGVHQADPVIKDN